MAMVAILDPRYKMMPIEFCFPKIYPETEATKNISMVHEALYKLYNEYVFIHTSTNTKKSSDSHFDALEWWKVINLKYHILSKMACDILSVPITLLALESRFSARGRVIDTYRASLSTKIVQILLCGAD
ncbi:hypothetical protein ACSBR2_004085 [Camellia fascicularis]